MKYLEKTITYLVKTKLIKTDAIEKSEDIEHNINSGYYNQKKYVYLNSKSLLEEIEEIVNNISIPREYTTNLTSAKKILTRKLNKYNYITQNDDTWYTDWQHLNNVPDDVMSKISNIIYDMSIDEYNKPSTADELLSLYQLNR